MAACYLPAYCADASVIDGGVRVLTLQDSSELASVCIIVGAGSAHEDASTAGTSGILADVLLNAGTDNELSPRLAVEELGGRAGASAGVMHTCYTLVVPNENLAPALKVMAGAVLKPVISGSSLREAKRLRRAAEDGCLDSPVTGAYMLFLEKTHPDDPFRFVPGGLPGQAGRVSLEGLVNWHGLYYRPDNVLVSYCGKLDRESFEKTARDAFKGMAATNAGGRAARPAVGSAVASTGRYEVVSRLNGAVAVVGFSAPPPGSADFAAVKLAQTALAGGMGSRLFRLLRDDSFYAYSFGSILPEDGTVSRLAFYVSTDPDKVEDAVVRISEAVSEIKDGRLTVGELERARAVLAGSLDISAESGLEKAMRDGRYEMMGLGSRYASRFAAEVAATGREEVARAARKYMDKYTLVVVKPGAAR